MGRAHLWTKGDDAPLSHLLTFVFTQGEGEEEEEQEEELELPISL